jgi:hypothetical protein
MGTVRAQPVRDKGFQLSIYDVMEMEDALRPFMVEPLPRAARERIESAWLLLQDWKRQSLQGPSSPD